MALSMRLENSTAMSSTNMRGMASPTSTPRMSTASIPPRKYPAAAPTPAPTVTATSIASVPMPSDSRAPYTTRLHTSRL